MEGSIHGSGVRVAGEGHEWRHMPVGSLVVGAGALEVEVVNFGIHAHRYSQCLENTSSSVSTFSY